MNWPVGTVIPLVTVMPGQPAISLSLRYQTGFTSGHSHKFMEGTAVKTATVGGVVLETVGTCRHAVDHMSAIRRRPPVVEVWTVTVGPFPIDTILGSAAHNKRGTSICKSVILLMLKLS
jgi:hypothetical protein